jgi:hypothetical protein
MTEREIQVRTENGAMRAFVIHPLRERAGA